MAKVSIDTNFVTSVISTLNSSCNVLEEVSSNIESAFQVLIDLQLVSSSVSKIKKQAKSIADLEKQFVSSASSHIGEVTDNEQKLKIDYESRSSHTSGGSSSPVVVASSLVSSENKFEVSEVDEGKEVNDGDTEEVISNITPEESIDLVELLKTNKEKDTDLKSLLFDDTKNKELSVALSNIFKEEDVFDDLTIEETNNIQKVLLNKMYDAKSAPDELKESFVFKFKDYLEDVCSKNNLKIGDLILDKKNDTLLKDSLKDLFEGISDDDTDTDRFIEYVTSVADKNNMSIENLIENNVDLLL